MTAQRIRLRGGFADVPPPVLCVPEDPAAVAHSRERLLDDAHAEADSIRQQARDQGRREGHQQARQQAMSLVEQLSALARGLTDERSHLLKDAQDEIVDLVIDATRQLFNAELEARPQAVLNLIRPALERIADPSRARLRLHPEDADLVRLYAVEAAIPMPELVADATLERGDCILDTAGGRTDARIATRLQKIREALGGAIP